MSELLVSRSLGSVLKAAREKRGLSVAEVVEVTHIKPHIIVALESNNFSAIAAPLYGKGFIKLYASHLGLDPAPLIEQYLSHYARSVRPTLKTEVPPPSAVNDGIPQPSPLARFKESSDSVLTNLANATATAARDTLEGLAGFWSRIKASRREAARGRDRGVHQRMSDESDPMPVGRYAAVGFAAVVVAMLVVSVVYWLVGAKESPAARSQPVETVSKVTPVRPLRLAAPPPAPYLKLK